MFHLKTQEFVPGIALCITVSAAAMALERLEVPLLGRIWFEALILAILLGAVMRTLWPLDKRWFAGINFSAKTPLEFAVMLLGSSISARTVMAIGPTLLGGIAVVGNWSRSRRAMA